MFGHRHDYDDADLLDVVNTISETFHIICSSWGQVRANDKRAEILTTISNNW